MMLHRRAWLALAALLAAPAGALAQAPPETLKPGDTVPAFETEAVAGGRQRIDFATGPTVLMFFLSSCPHCHRQIPEWNRAYERRGKGLRVVGVIMDREPPGFWELTPVAFPVLRGPSGADFRSAYKVVRVPMTVRVAKGGKVESAVVGSVDPIRLGEMFRP